MKELSSPFFAYRYLVSPSDNQTSILHDLNKPKEKLILDIFSSINDKHKTVWHKGLRKYLFYGFQNDNELFIVKFARESTENIFVEGELDIEVQDIKEAKFVYMFIDTKYQIILLERNQRIFSKVESAIDIIEEYLREQMRKFDYAVNIYPLVSSQKFWGYVDSADEIFELSLVLNAPNMFHGGEDTRNVLQKIKEITNNETLNIAVKNKEGKLHLVKETIGKWIDYVREVGGRYVLKFKKDGILDTKTSESDTSKVYIKRKKKSKYTDEELAEIKTKMEQIHYLKSRDNTNKQNG